MDDHEFLDFATAPAGLVQYGGRSKACQLILDEVLFKMDDKIKATQAFMNAFNGHDDLLRSEPERLKFSVGMLSNGFEDMVKNTTYDPDKMWRQWYYQVCTEVGYF